MRNQLQTYFLPDDESALSAELRNLSPTIFFVDRGEAESSSVGIHTDLSACGSGFAYIWDAETTDAATAQTRWQELVRIKSGDDALAQFLRSRIAADELVNGETVDLLLSGRVAVMGRGTEKQKDLKTRVYGAVSKISTADVFPVSPTTRELLGPKVLGSRVGRHAAAWCKDPSHLLRPAGTNLPYSLPAVQ